MRIHERINLAILKEKNCKRLIIMSIHLLLTFFRKALVYNIAINFT